MEVAGLHQQWHPLSLPFVYRNSSSCPPRMVRFHGSPSSLPSRETCCLNAGDTEREPHSHIPFLSSSYTETRVSGAFGLFLPPVEREREREREREMAYMCADSGNLMAIAQQLIQQQQQQQEQQLHHHHHHHHMAASLNPSSTTTTTATAPWGSHYHPPFSDHHFLFSFQDPIFPPDPFASTTPTFSFPPPDPGAPFRLSDFPSSSSAAAAAADFESDEWMESLIGDSPTESSDMISDAWHGSMTHLPPPASTSDLHHIIFPESHKIDQDSAFLPAPNTQPPSTTAAQIHEKAPSLQPSDPKDQLEAAPGAEETGPTPPLLESLLDCARIADSDPSLAAKSLIRIRKMASDTGDSTQRVAFYFAEALSRRLSPEKDPVLAASADVSPWEMTMCHKAFSDACPYTKFAHLTANQSILEATDSASRIHIVDFGIVHGVQWAALLQALGTRPSGKPTHIRISGVPSPAVSGDPPPSPAARLSDFAAMLDLDFEYEHVSTLAEVRLDPTEAVAVNFMLQLHHLLDETTEAVEETVKTAKKMNPVVVTLGEYELSLNWTGFADRFGGAARYYAAAFESVEAAMGKEPEERRRVEAVLLGRRLTAAVEGTERMEGMDTWRAVMEGCGMEAVGVSNYAVSQARILLWSYEYSSKYSVVEVGPGWLSLAWEERPMITVSSWR